MKQNKKLKIFLIVLIITAVLTAVITNYIRRDKGGELESMTPKEFKRTAVDLNLTVNNGFRDSTISNAEVNESYTATSELSSINITFMVFNTNEQSDSFYTYNKEGKTKIKEQATKSNYNRYEYELDNKQYDLYRIQNTILIISSDKNDSIAKEKIEQFKKSIMQK